MPQVNSYLSFNGNCEAAFDFYKSVFGGEFPYVGRYKEMPDTPMPDSEKEKIMHISLPIGNGTVLMGADISDAFGGGSEAGNNFAISITADSEEEANKLFNGLSEGGTVTMPLNKTFWGALFGMFTDKFGIPWMLNYDYPKNN